jgi:hypothetical protein
VELDVVQATKCGCVLILFADGFTTFLDLNAAGFVSQLSRRDMAASDGMKRMHEADSKAAR